MNQEIPVIKIIKKVRKTTEYYLPIGGSLFYVGSTPHLLELYLENHLGKLKEAISEHSRGALLRYSYEEIRKECVGRLPKPFIYRYKDAS